MKNEKIIIMMMVCVMFVVIGSAGVSAEGIDNYTKLMLHMDGTDGGTTFTDDSDSNHNVTAIADAHTNTSEKKFGSASAYFDGDGDYLSIPDSDDWHFAGGDFTIDVWVKPAATTTSGETIASQWNNDANSATVSWWFSRNSATLVNFGYNDGTSTWTSWTYNWTTNWQHVAIVRNGANLDLYVDGVKIGTTHNIGATVLGNAMTNLEIGEWGHPTATSYFNGYMDEFRITKGIARWTSNFTVPTSPYSSTVTFGNLTTYWITPTTDTNVQQNQFFKVQIGVNCTGGDCGDVNVTLDPEEVKKLIEDYKARQALDEVKTIDEAEQGIENKAVIAEEAGEKSWFERIIEFVKGVFG